MDAAKPAKDTSDPKAWPGLATPPVQTPTAGQTVPDGKPAEPKKDRKVRTLSAEVRAISHCEAILEKLTTEQAVRVANYILGISINHDRDRMRRENILSPFFESPIGNVRLGNAGAAGG